jgi:type II secretory pathway component PulK
MHTELDSDNSSGFDERGSTVTLVFDWDAYKFDARLDRKSLKASTLQISCDIGTIPFTAEGAQRRINIMSILEATKTGSPVRTTITPQRRMELIAETRLEAPVTTQSFITGIVTLAAKARPYLDLIQMLQQPAGSVRGR